MNARRTPSALVGLLLLALALLWAAPAAAFHFPWDQGHDTFQPDHGDEDTDPGDDSCPPNSCCLDSRGASPVEVISGNFIYRLRLFRLDGLGPEIDLTLTYNSRDRRQGPFGHGWVHEYDQRLVETTDGVDVVVICSKENGKRERFLRNSDGTYTPPDHLFGTLVKEADGFKWRDHLGLVRRFNTAGRLVELIDRNGNAVQFAYDATGSLASITDAVGRTVVLTKGSDGRVASIEDPAGRLYQFTYSAAGELIGFTNPRGENLSFAYDAKSNLNAVIDSLGRIQESLTYDASGRVATHFDRGETWTYQYFPASRRTVKRDSAGRAWTIDYNDAGVATRRIDPLGNIETFVYDDSLNVVRHTDQRSQVAAMTYDGRGNLLTRTDPAGGVQTMTYEPVFNRILTQTDAGGNVTTMVYDDRGNLLSRTDAAGNQTTLEYDGRGQLVRLVDASGGIYSFAYDSWGNLASVTDPLGRVSRATHDVLGKVVTTTDPAGRVTEYVYDESERLIELINALGDRTALTYDSNGSLTSLVLPTGATTRFEYDEFHRPIRRIGPLGEITTYEYDRRGNLISRRDAKGQEIRFTYDALDRLVTRQRIEDTVSFTYDAAGNVLSVTDSDSQVSFVYDALGRIITARTGATAAQPASTIQYSYDSRSNVIAMSDSAAGSFTYAYDALSRVVGLTSSNGDAFELEYDPLSRRVALRGPHGIGTTYEYDQSGQALSLLLTGGGLTESILYQYDLTGNRTSRSDQHGTHEYSFDLLSQLLGVSGDFAEAYTYDAAGNRTSSHLSSIYQVNARNQILSDDRFDYSYDANGNLVRVVDRSSGTSTSYSYDSDNQLVRIDGSNGSFATYRYDGLGRRIEKDVDGQVTQYVYDDNSILLEYVGGVFSARYTHLPESVDEVLALERLGERTYFQADAIGSIVREVSADGVPRNFRYDSYGRLLGEERPSGPYAFQGRELDAESGLYYFRARYYHPGLGRFVSEDPIGFTGGVNLYAFVRNNPVMLTDPSGLQPGRGFGGFLEDVIEFFPDAFGADKDFWDNYTDMRDANTIGADKYFHCKANCEAARRGPGGATEASLVSELRELLDEYIKGDPPAACDADRAANDHGRDAGRNNRNVDCRQACSPFRPNGLDPRY